MIRCIVKRIGGIVKRIGGIVQRIGVILFRQFGGIVKMI